MTRLRSTLLTLVHPLVCGAKLEKAKRLRSTCSVRDELYYFPSRFRSGVNCKRYIGATLEQAIKPPGRRVRCIEKKT